MKVKAQSILDDLQIEFFSPMTLLVVCVHCLLLSTEYRDLLPIFILGEYVLPRAYMNFTFKTIFRIQKIIRDSVRKRVSIT